MKYLGAVLKLFLAWLVCHLIISAFGVSAKYAAGFALIGPFILIILEFYFHKKSQRMDHLKTVVTIDPISPIDPNENRVFYDESDNEVSEEESSKTRWSENMFHEAAVKYGLPDHADIVDLTGWKYYAFIYNNDGVKELRLLLCPISRSERIRIGEESMRLMVDNRKAAIPVRNINYFMLTGDVYTTTQTIRTGGSGPNMSAALAGGIVGGQTGAMIGMFSPKPSSTITNTVRHDKRYTILVAFDDVNLKFTKGAYDIFLDLIPEKEASVARYNLGSKGLREAEQLSVSDRLKNLTSLLEEGLITEEEFCMKRAKILEEV